MLPKDVFCFSNKSKNRQNEGFWGGRNEMRQMYELKNLVTVKELWISNFFLKPNYVSTFNIPAVILKNGR